MKMLKIIGIIVAALILGYAILSYINTRPLSRESALANIQGIVNKAVTKKDTISGVLIHVDSDFYQINETFVSGQISKNQPFHVASVGKAFTATLLGKFIDDGVIRLDTRISEYLSQDILYGQFVVEGVDYAEEVTVGQLLNHTSGAADYFGDDVIGGSSLIQLVLKEPDRFWSPTDLLDFSAEYQTAFGKPGEAMHYSDNNYIMLGLLLESISDKPFHQLLDEIIFTPLEMDDTYLMFYQDPKNETKELADIFLEATNIKDYTSLSIDWAGGGIISTAADLSIFIRALNTGEIISNETLDKLYNFDWKYMRGIHYGYGFMNYAFGEYFPGLGSLGDYRGHMGVLGTQMFYEKETDTVYIASYGSTDASSASVQDMIKVISTLKRIDDID